MAATTSLLPAAPAPKPATLATTTPDAADAGAVLAAVAVRDFTVGLNATLMAALAAESPAASLAGLQRRLDAYRPMNIVPLAKRRYA